MSNLAYSIIHPQPRKLTLGLVLALTLFSLTVNAQTVVRTGSGGTVSGTDIGAVQTATGAAEGDVIKVSDGAVFNTSVTNPVSGFTIESSTGNVVNVPVQSRYYFPQTPTDPVNAAFRNVSFTSADSYTSFFWGGYLHQNNIIDITIDGNVSFSNFKDSVFDYYQMSTSNQYCPYKFTCTSGSTLTFSGNTADYHGGAIYRLGYLSGSGNTLEFTDNIARNGYGGAIYTLSDLAGNNSTLKFSGNTAYTGGAIHTLGYFGSDGTYSGGLTGDNNTLTFTGNTAESYGGAIHTFTDLSGSGNTLEFSENTAAEDGGAIYQLGDFSGSGNTLTFSSNTANGTGGVYFADHGGGAIYTISDLAGNNNTLKFTGNTAAEGHGGAICELTNLSGSGNTLEFSGNTAAIRGGAIYIISDLAGNNNTLNFSDNTAAKIGGAIYGLGNYGGTLGLTGNNNTLKFEGNTAEAGGAIHRLENLSGSGNILEFTGNTAETLGGAISGLTNLSGSGNTLDFSENTAAKSGGAIFTLGDSSRTGLTGNNNKLTFSKNTANGTGDEDGGGAIWKLYNLGGSGNTLEFDGNTAEGDGGAIWNFQRLLGSNNTLTFTGNTAGGNGGAIYSYFSIEFSGNNTLTFTGNKAGKKGNDIYLYGDDDYEPVNLTFSGGTYSFDGGIWLAEYNGQTGTTTISNGTKVTIAGRNDDSVNEYEFRDVALTANLTATLDDIEYLHGKFTVGENGLMTIKKGSDTATIKSSSNDGVFDLLINKAEEVETISISSGRIDIKGYMDASIELQNDAELQSVASFSPGNSAGRLETTGDFISTAGSLLIFEQEGDVYDQLIANNVTIDPETGIDLSLFTTFAPGAVYDIIIANGTLSVDQSWIDMIQSGLPEFVEASIYNGNTVRLKIDANAVPEPSTWALLILGAAGLAYMRKHSRQ